VSRQQDLGAEELDLRALPDKKSERMSKCLEGFLAAGTLKDQVLRKVADELRIWWKECGGPDSDVKLKLVVVE
jgi:hypothetical protein